MKIIVAKGKYVVAVSGGVDSMVLLNLLSKMPGLDLVAAHFNHGIRADSDIDEALVQQTAAEHNLPFEIGYGALGPTASEDTARQARYKFLNEIKAKHQAKAIITAHHQDDLIETALLNVLRGSGRRGLTAITQNQSVLRPLINVPKTEIIGYAKLHNLQWHEDPTNADPSYLRNYLRQNLSSSLRPAQRQDILKNIKALSKTNPLMDELIVKLSNELLENGQIDRQKFTALPTEVGTELVHHWLKQLKIEDLDKKTIQRTAMAIKTAKAGSKHNIKKGSYLILDSQYAWFGTPETTGLI